MHGRAHSWADALSTFSLLLIKTCCVSWCSFRACMCTSFSSHLQDFMRQTKVLSFFLLAFQVTHWVTSLGEKKPLVNHHSWGRGEKAMSADVRIPGQRASSFCLSPAASRLASNSTQKWLLLQSNIKQHVAGAECLSRIKLPIIAKIIVQVRV